MKRERRITIKGPNSGEADEGRAALVLIVPSDATPPEGEALHVLSRDAAAALLRGWRRKGRPFRDRSPHPILCAITWALSEEIRVTPEEPENHE